MIPQSMTETGAASVSFDDGTVLLQSSLRWFILIAIGFVACFTGIDLLLLVLDPYSSNEWFLISDVLLLGSLATAYAQQRRGRLKHAAIIISLGFLPTALLVSLLRPGQSFLLLLPLIGLAISLPYLDSRDLLWLSAAVFVTMVLVDVIQGVLLISESGTPVALDEHGVLIATNSLATATTTILLLYLLRQFHQQLNRMLRQSYEANHALQEAFEQVQQQAEEQARLLAENTQQRETIRELGVPVLPISATSLVMPLVGALDTARLQQVQERALDAIQRATARYLVLDITGVPVVDTQVAQGLIGVVQAARLLGARVVLVGVRPEVAQAMVTLGIRLDGIQTAATLADGLEQVR